MTNRWNDYQDEAASFFRSLGFDSKVEETIEGVRGAHNIDVWVTGEVHGISFRWVVECKHWKRNIPKEKVMALISIVQDVGADRGFLLSEIGFQSGAIRAAHKSNVTLTSIADLKNEAQESLVEITAANIHLRLSRLKNKLFKLHKKTDEYYSEFVTLIGRIGFLEMALGDALEGRFPTVYSIDENDKRLSVSDWDEFFARATELADEIDRYINNHA